LPLFEHVLAIEDPNATASQLKKRRRRNAFPMQLNPVIYTAIFSLFASESMKAAIHLNANVCQTLAVYDQEEWQLHCWETDEDLTQAGILHAAYMIADWNYNEQKKVKIAFLPFSYFIFLVKQEKTAKSFFLTEAEETPEWKLRKEIQKAKKKTDKEERNIVYESISGSEDEEGEEGDEEGDEEDDEEEGEEGAEVEDEEGDTGKVEEPEEPVGQPIVQEEEEVAVKGKSMFIFYLSFDILFRKKENWQGVSSTFSTEEKISKGGNFTCYWQAAHCQEGFF
jgi:hypothetical protein